jgi:hypothetical protein
MAAACSGDGRQASRASSFLPSPRHGNDIRLFFRCVAEALSFRLHLF